MFIILSFNLNSKTFSYCVTIFSVDLASTFPTKFNPAKKFLLLLLNKGSETKNLALGILIIIAYPTLVDIIATAFFVPLSMF